MPADFVPKTIDLIRCLPEIILTVRGVGYKAGTG